MNKLVFPLSLVASAALGLAAFLDPGRLAPSTVPLGLVLAGGLVAAAGALWNRNRVLAAGVLAQLAGLGLTGPFQGALVAWVGTVGVVLAVGAWSLALALPDPGRGQGMLLAAALGTGLAVATVGWTLMWGLGSLGGGGGDARAALTAWVALAGSLTWGLYERAGRWTP